MTFHSVAQGVQAERRGRLALPGGDVADRAGEDLGLVGGGVERRRTSTAQLKASRKNHQRPMAFSCGANWPAP